jgi:two-component system CheB/CheR fusion protein
MQKRHKPFLAGIGGSSGSIPAIKRFLAALGHADGIAFVIQCHAQHAPGVTAASVFQSSTPLKVLDAENGCEVKAGCVFVAAAHQPVSLKGESLQVGSNKGSKLRLRSIDRLFHSLAKAAGAHSAGILFSGEDSDGVIGLEELAHSGALTLVQDPITADHRNTPETAIALSAVDCIGTPERLAEELHAYLARWQEGQGITKPVEVQTHDLSEICQVLEEATGHDFRHYKTSTLVRRISRRIHIAGAASADDYLLVLRNNPEEARHLMRDLLIGVTSFFRDPMAFEALAEVALKPLLRTAASPVRIWAPGCGTGQEVYSLAMLVTELQDNLNDKADVQIFATDLDERALNIARRGIYPRSMSDEVSPARLDRFFEPHGHRFQVSKELRKLLIFSPHNLISDPPFSRLNLISCRNLLIYLGPHLQKKLMSVFHYSLRDDGFLFLGSSESVAGYSELFRIVDAKHRIAQRKSTGAHRMKLPLQTGIGTGAGASRPQEVAEVDIGALSQRILLDEFAPPYAIVNQDAQVVYLSQRIGAFLQPPEGEYANNIFRMARRGLRVGLRSAWGEAQELRRKAVYEGLSVELEGEPHHIRLTVQPMPDVGHSPGLTMIVFQIMGPVATGSNASQPHSPEEAERLVAQLEGELLRTRDELERAVQDLEAANEELKSSNEELLSMNEELQSSNEELESSKEEVEAANLALAGTNADVQNLLHSTELATIFIDASGCLRRFTPAATALYNLALGDLGRPLHHFTHVFDDLEIPSLDDVLKGGTRLEREVRSKDGRTFLQRVTPYRTADGEPDGTVITFLDITQQKETQHRLKLAEQEAEARLAELESVYATAPVGLALLDRDFRYLRINDALADMNGFPAREHLGKTVHEIVPDLVDDLMPLLKHVLETGETIGPREVTGETAKKPGQQRTWLESWGPVVSPSGELIGVQGSAKDITDRKQAQVSVAASEARLRRLIDNLFAFVSILTPEGILVETNKAPLQIAGLAREDVIGKPFWDGYWWNFSEASRQRLKDAFAKALNGETVRYDVEMRVASDRSITIDLQLAPLKDEAGQVIEVISSGIDISERVTAEHQRELLIQELNHRVKNTLATIQAITHVSLRHSRSIKDFAAGFSGRLLAIARAHEGLVNGTATSSELADIVHRQVGPYAESSDGSLSIQGPPITLSASEAHNLGLILHEMATNATKHGSLSRAGGKVDIAWTLDPHGGRVVLVWTETGGPRVEQPASDGFGSRLIRQMAASLEGNYRPTFEAGGFAAELEFPIAR